MNLITQAHCRLFDRVPMLHGDDLVGKYADEMGTVFRDYIHRAEPEGVFEISSRLVDPGLAVTSATPAYFRDCCGDKCLNNRHKLIAATSKSPPISTSSKHFS